MRHLSVLGPVAAGLLVCSSLVFPSGASAVSCAPPGTLVTMDPPGDPFPPEGITSGTLPPLGPNPVGQAAQSQPYDILSVSVAEPAHAPGKRLLAITLQVASLQSLPASSYWWVHLITGSADNFVSMRTPDPSASNQAPIFERGTVSNGNFSIDGPIEAQSSYDANRGTITYIVQNSAVGNPGDGAKIDQVTAEAGTFGNAGPQPLFTNAWDDTINGTVGSYTLGSDGSCGILPGGDLHQASFGGISPRYQIYTPPVGVGVQSQGEFSIGYNPKTGRIMAMSDNITYRLTQPQRLTPALPDSCEAGWENVSPLVADATSADPILFTEQISGRTFISNQTTGANALFAYTDDDGDNWIEASAAPPNGSADHETIAAGPYPAGSPFTGIAQAAGVDYAVYYCAQSQRPAFCQRSDDGGASFGNGVPIYNGVTSQCHGIHGHAKVSPDGTVYVPNQRGCGTNQGGAVSMDAGQSWSEFIVSTATTAPGFDPSLGVASDNTVYFCSVNADGHPHVAVSKDHGATWANDYDIGASQGIQNAVFVQAVAGDPDRAACGFVGTTTGGNYNSLDFKGVWYLYIATTYDGGRSWTTVNATPGDPVQGAGGICSGGIGCNSNPNNRNLLDFNEITADDTGHVLYGFDDGCVSDVCIRHPESNNDFTANLRVARQSGGRGLFAKFDMPEPARPRNACLAGRRDSAGAHLKWKAPDNSGAAISGYNVFRAPTANGPFTKVGSAGPGATFDDPTADKNAADYFYRITALNSAGEGSPSNVVDIKPGPDPVIETTCSLPGVRVIDNGSGHATDMLPAHDILSVHIAEPANMPGKLGVTMNVADLSTLPPNTQWIVLMTTPGKKRRFVAMTSEGGTVAFKAGDVGLVDATAATVTTYTYTDDLDPASNYKPDGTITLIVPMNLIGSPQPGDALTGVEARTRIVTSGQLLSAGRAMDDTQVASYQLVGTARCSGGKVLDGAAAQNSHGVVVGNGSLGWLTLLPLLGAGLARRRRH